MPGGKSEMWDHRRFRRRRLLQPLNRTNGLEKPTKRKEEMTYDKYALGNHFGGVLCAALTGVSGGPDLDADQGCLRGRGRHGHSAYGHERPAEREGQY